MHKSSPAINIHSPVLKYHHFNMSKHLIHSNASLAPNYNIQLSSEKLFLIITFLDSSSLTFLYFPNFLFTYQDIFN